MKKLSALIKIERRPVIFMSIYFLIINVIAIIAIMGQINSNWKSYLARGIEGAHMWVMDDFVYNITYILLIGYGIGVLVLVYLQFKNDKSIEISRFIKSLPYTNGQRGFVKIGLGVLSITTTFAIYVIMFFMARNYAMNLFGEIYTVTAFEQATMYLNRVSVYLSFMGITYARMLVIYLIFVMCEYLISHNIGSLVVAILATIAPVYIWFSGVYSVMRNTITNQIREWLYRVYVDYTTWGKIEIKSVNEWDYLEYRITENGGIVFGIYVVVILICSFVIAVQIKKQCVENADILMPGKLTRYVFISGVALCSACLVRDIGRMVIGQICFGYPVIVLYILLIIGLVSGSYIAIKITHIGRGCKKGGVTHEN